MLKTRVKATHLKSSLVASLLVGGLVACTSAPSGTSAGTNAPNSTSSNLSSSTTTSSTGNNALQMTLSNGSAYSTQAVTGAPSSPTFNHVYVNFSKVQIHYDGAASASAPATTSADTDPGWEDFSASSSQTIDLVNLPTDTGFGAMTNLKNGTYTQIRLVVNSAMVDYTLNGVEATASLDISSGDLKIIKPFTLSDDQKTILHFDFDTNHSLVDANGAWRMNPTAIHTVATYVALPAASPSPSPSASSSV